MRLAVAIGCNVYDSGDYDMLGAAELDARSIFGALIDESHGGYSPDKSILLLSPTLDEIRSALRSALTENGSLETFTFYFAGHGCVRNCGFYMLGRDAKDKSLAFTGLSLSDLFRMVADANPGQTNIVIDACEAGGLISDLSTILKPELMGEAQTLSLTLLATAARNESAAENELGGYGTQVIVKCLRGEEFVQEHSPMLDLMDVGRHVAHRLSGSGQTPVVWGLNLSAISQFALNHFYSSEASSSVRVLVKEWEAKSDRSLQQHAKSIWELHSSVAENWDPSQARTTLQTVYASLVDEPAMLVGFARRLRSSLLMRAESDADVSRVVEVVATIAVSLLQHVGNSEVGRLVEELLSEVGQSILQMCDQLILDLEEDKFALLEKDSGAGTLYTLPIRLTKILAWASLPVLASCLTKSESADVLRRFARVVSLVLEHYELSVTTVAEEQASGWALVFAALKKAKLVEQEERILCIIFNRLLRTKARILRKGVPGQDVLDYLLAVDANDLGRIEHAIDRPIETLAVVLRAAHVAGLGDILDEELWRLDGCSLMVFVPDNYSNFDAQVIDGGQNYEWQIGNQIFRTSDFASSWPAIPESEGPVESALCMMASLLFPDRVAWFCLS